MRFKNISGLTLIETVIALSLVVVLSTAFAGALATGLKSENQMENRKEAVNFASEIIDNLKIRTGNNENLFSKIIKEKGYSETSARINFSDINNYFSNSISNQSQYTAEISYQEESSDLLELTVEIEWTASGGSYNEKIVTLMAVDLDE
jgi:type II secretory pathway pseudopilin PulG